MSNKKKLFYAVKVRRNVGIFSDWEICKQQVIGYPNAVYKGFYNKKDAEEFLFENNSIKEETNENNIIAYVDGSYIPSKPECFSFGVVLIENGKIEKYSKKIINKEEAMMRNVAGEVYGAMYAINLCLERKGKVLNLYYDYTGIEKWCTGEWKANKILTKKLKLFYETIKDKIDIRFHKVESHTGVKYNDLADSLAKDALFN